LARGSGQEPVSAVLLALVSGALWGVFAVLTKGVVERLDGGLLALLRTPELYVWVLVAIAGTAWQQSSFRAGALTASLPTMTVAVAVMVAATVALARGEAAVATRQPA
jgi:drug/metabolite transporter (DMT)-like permease